MVMTGEDVPDPPNNLEKSLSSNEDIFLGEDSAESDDEQSHINVTNDYQPLPIGPDDIYEENENRIDSYVEIADEIEANENEELPCSSAESEILKEVWCGVSREEPSIQLDSNKIDEVKRAMMSVTLPPNVIPEWAKNIAEDQWKEFLLNRIQNRNTNS